jgi:hypothetical protein
MRNAELIKYQGGVYYTGINLFNNLPLKSRKTVCMPALKDYVLTHSYSVDGFTSIEKFYALRTSICEICICIEKYFSAMARPKQGSTERKLNSTLLCRRETYVCHLLSDRPWESNGDDHFILPMSYVVYFSKPVLQGFRLYYDTNLFRAKEIFLLYSTFLLAYQTSSYSFTTTRPRSLHFYNTVLCSRLKGTFILHSKQHAILKLRACPGNLCI